MLKLNLWNFAVLVCIAYTQAKSIRRLVCGPNFQLYFTNEHFCANGTLVPLHKPKTTTTTTTTTSTVTTPTTTMISTPTVSTRLYKRTKKPKQCIQKESIIERCPPKSTRICGKLKCCGYNTVYDPTETTCCSMMHKTALFNTPERDTVCCGLDNYERGKQPCLHPTQNDRLWEKHPALTTKHSAVLCKYDFVYVLKSVRRGRKRRSSRQRIQQVHEDGRQVKVGQKKPTRRTTKMKLATDEYTPRRGFGRRPLVILTNIDRFENPEFFVYTPDMIFELKHRRTLKKLLRKCRRRQRRHNNSSG